MSKTVPANCSCKVDPETLALVMICGFHKHVRDLSVLDERKRCLKIVQDEPELPGAIPAQVREHFEEIGMEEAHRMTVRVTKASISRRIMAEA